MKTYLVSRHPGTLDWFASQGLAIEVHIPHLDPDTIQAGDIVVGTLPIQLAAKVCEAGARYIHLEVQVPFDMRGQELSSQQLEEYGAKLSEFKVFKCE